MTRTHMHAHDAQKFRSYAMLCHDALSPDSLRGMTCGLVIRPRCTARAGVADRTVQVQLQAGIRCSGLRILPQHAAQALRHSWVLHLHS